MLKHAGPLRALLFLLSVAAAVAPGGARDDARRARRSPQETAVIVDSQMNEQEAFDGLDPECPAEIRNRQKIVEVSYYSDDGKVHRGQLVVDGELEQDVKKVFEVALRERTPIHSVLPASHPSFRRNGRWDDNLTMEANNTSAFNYRPKTGGGSLSVHAYGRAIDINPFINPYISVRNRRPSVQPRGAKYDPKVPGTFTARHPVVREFIRLGWQWGGNWKNPKDYQHFEKPRR